MGVPGLFPFIQHYYKENVQSFIEGEIVIQCNCFYLDANSILHTICQKIFHYGKYAEEKDEYTSLTFEEKKKFAFELFFERIDYLHTMFPSEELIISLDGPAPVAKQCQQRQRRFLSAMSKVEGDLLTFDSNSLTSGTEFIFDLSRYMHYKLRKRIATELTYQKTKILYSSPFVPGEGEHKIMNYIRQFKKGSEDKHIVMGPDADLIILCMALEMKNVLLARENQFEEGGMYLVDISKLTMSHYNYVSHHYVGLTTKELVPDFILQSLLVGNDFLPRIKMFYYLKDGLNTMNNVYMSMKKVIVNDSIIQQAPFINFIKMLSEYEVSYIQQQVVVPVAKKMEDTLLMKFISGSDFDFDGYKKEYYEKAEVKGSVNNMCKEYIRGLQWILLYYTKELPSWDWFYPYHYAPFMIDILVYVKNLTASEFSDIISFKEKSKPKKPVFQLLCVIPSFSKNLLPYPFDKLLEDKSPLAKYFPKTFEIDYAGKEKEYMGVPLIPFVDNKLFYGYYVKFLNIKPQRIPRNEFEEEIFLEYNTNIIATYEDDEYTLKNINVKRNLVYSPSIKVGIPSEIKVEYKLVPSIKVKPKTNTTVVCVKVGNIRPKYNNLQEWMANKNNVYIGRKGIVFIDKKRFPAKDSVWANPYKIDKDGTRDQVIKKYREYIVQKIKNKEVDITELAGKTLGCWCKPEPCHGDVLVELVEEYA